MIETVPTICRICHNGCGVLADVEDGRVVRVRGDPDNPLFGGYSCVKGRAQADFLRDPGRLLHSIQRSDAGFEPIPVAKAMDEIAVRLEHIIARHGPRAVATYSGTSQVATATGVVMMNGFMDALGSPMRFDPRTIDKGGKPVARSMHGTWMAPAHNFHEPDVAFLIGANPHIAHQGFPLGNPKVWLRDQLKRGMKLIVVDPRRTEVAQSAHLHIRPRPGHDLAIVAAILRIVIDEALYERDFVAENAQGLAELRRHLEPYSAERVAALAGIDADDLRLAARTIAAAPRGFTLAGVGPHMSSGRGTLLEYLVLNLDTLCGHWSRAGERVHNPGVLFPMPAYKAQARPPWKGWGFGEQLRVRGLGDTMGGLPCAALPDEILLKGEGQVRALIVYGGNPAVAWPDQIKAVEALRSLELLVTIDPWMSQTAKLADYVIAPTMPLEVPSSTIYQEVMAQLGTGYGLSVPYVQITDAVVARPEGSDLIEEGAFFHGLAQRMNLVVEIAPALFYPDKRYPVQDEDYATETLLRLMCQDSRIAFDELKAQPHGAIYPLEARVLPKDEGWEGRFELANPLMMADLDQLTEEYLEDGGRDDGYPLRLLCRRLNHSYNSSCNHASTNRGVFYNPAFMHPDDLARFGLSAADVIEIESDRAVIKAVVEPDGNLMPGIISMAFGYGDPPGLDGNVRETGSCTSRLLWNDKRYDPYCGQPLMSNIPVRIRKMADTIAQ